MTVNLVEHIGLPAMLEQTAEECNEMAFVCLKLARDMRGENKVYGRSRVDMIMSLIEEMADLEVCFEQLEEYSGLIEEVDVIRVLRNKKERMKQRLEAENEL